MKLGKALVKSILEGKAYGQGRFAPPGSYNVEVQAFSFFESDNKQGEIFKIEFKVEEVLFGGLEWTKGENPAPAVTSPGDERVQLIMMKFQAAAGDVANFVGAALGVYLEMGDSVDWQDYEVLESLLTHFDVDPSAFADIKKTDDRHGAMAGALLEALVDPERQPFSGLKLRLDTVDKLTKTNKKWIVTHRWGTPSA
jgi:hypothetical protein